MATKRFCDYCGRECGPVAFAKFGDDHHVQLFNTVGKKDICKYCAIDAFNKLDDRQPARAARGELGDHDLDSRLRVRCEDPTMIGTVMPREPTPAMIERGVVGLREMVAIRHTDLAAAHIWRRMFDAMTK